MEKLLKLEEKLKKAKEELEKSLTKIKEKKESTESLNKSDNSEIIKFDNNNQWSE